MVKYGKATWGETPNKFNSNKSYSRENVMILQEGQNKVRMITVPYKFLFHKEKFENDSNDYGRNIRCATDNCPLCAKGSRAKEKYVVGVINRADGTYKLLELSSTIYTAIQGILEVEGNENLIDYDIVIKKNSKAPPANFYQTLTGARTPLSANDIEMMDKVDESELEKYIQPISAEEVSNSVERIERWLAKKAAEANGGGGNTQQQGGGGRQQSTPRKGAAQSVDPTDEQQAPAAVSEDMFNFKEHKK